MKCVWFGDMTKWIDIFKFKAILDNCHTWAMRELRPLISFYVGIWRRKHILRETPKKPPSQKSHDAPGHASSPLQMVLWSVERPTDPNSDDNEDGQGGKSQDGKQSIAELLEMQKKLLQSLGEVQGKLQEALSSDLQRFELSNKSSPCATQFQESPKPAASTSRPRQEDLRSPVAPDDLTYSSEKLSLAQSSKEDPFQPLRKGESLFGSPTSSVSHNLTLRLKETNKTATKEVNDILSRSKIPRPPPTTPPSKLMLDLLGTTPSESQKYGATGSSSVTPLHHVAADKDKVPGTSKVRPVRGGLVFDSR